MNFFIKIFYSDNDKNKPLYVKIINLIFVFLIIGLVLALSYNKIMAPNLSGGQTAFDKFSVNMGRIYKYRETVKKGFMLTILISLWSLFFSLLFGFLGAVFQRSRIQVLHYIGKMYVELVRGTPLLVQIIAVYYFVGTLFELNDKFAAGILILSIFEGAYISEIIRAGVESISNTQIETARSLSLTKVQTYIYIIFPQVIRRILPPLAGQFVSLVKDSSLLSIIALAEFTQVVQNITSLNFNYTEGYILLGAGYLILTFPISILSKYLERKFNYET